MAKVVRYNYYGSTWYGGAGSKDAMKQNAIEKDHVCMLGIQDPDSGNYGYVSYDTWATGVQLLKTLDPHQRHVYELIQYGRMCKPYIDIDGARETLPAGLTTCDEIVQRMQNVVTGIFANDYDLELNVKDFVWSYSPNPDKMSLHLIIASHCP